MAQLELHTPYGSLFIRACDRGEWAVHNNDDKTGLISFIGWGGEGFITLQIVGTLASYIEALVTKTNPDCPVEVYRVASRTENWEPETFLDRLVHLLEQLMDDGVEPQFPESRMVAKNRLEANDRHRETCSGRKDEQSQSTLWSELV